MPLSVRVVERAECVSATSWIAEVQKESVVPFDPFTGPLVRFVLLRDGDDGAACDLRRQSSGPSSSS